MSIWMNLSLRPRCKTLKVAFWDLDLIDLSTLCCHLHFHLGDTLTVSIVSGAIRLLRCNVKEKGNQTTFIPFHLIYFICNLQDPKQNFFLLWFQGFSYLKESLICFYFWLSLCNKYDLLSYWQTINARSKIGETKKVNVTPARIRVYAKL